MKPATEKQKEQLFFMEPQAEIELNVTSADGAACVFQTENEPTPCAFAQNTTTHD